MSAKITDSYLGKTILISGGRGYIGSTLTQALAKIKCKIIILDKLPKNYWLPKNPKAEIYIIKGDISLQKTWESVLPGVDYLFHLAALEYNRVNFNVLHDYQVNAFAVIYLLELCKNKKYRPKIIFSSSANIFGLVNKLPISEIIPSNPTSLWSVHKLVAENYLHIYAQKFGIKSVILRLANVYGPSVNPHAVANVIINKAIIQALNSQHLTLFTNKECIRDYIYIDDVINAFLIAGSSDCLLRDDNFYIIGSGEGNKIVDVWKLIAQKVKRLSGKKVKLGVNNNIKLEPFDRRNFIADTTLFSKMTGWKPNVFLERGIELTIKALIDLNKNERL